MKYDVIIIGAGAAGLMCAIESGKRGRKTLLLDKSKSVGDKIRISGGGRCNFTNIHTSPSDYLSNNPHFCVSALKRYTQFDFIDLVKKHNITYHEKTLGQLFCDGSAKQVITMLTDECDLAGVEIQLQTTISDVNKSDNSFTVIANDQLIHSKSLVIATGGISIPKMGATGFGYDTAKQFGLDIITTRPALVPFTLDAEMLYKSQQLSGISLDAVVSCSGKSFEEAMLFTHRGLSGPAILQISSYWNDGNELCINLAPKHDVMAELQQMRSSHPKQDIQKSLLNFLPKRLAQHICDEENYAGRMADLSNKYLQEITNRLSRWKLTPNGTEGFRTAEVTIGGVNTNELSSKTLESKKVSGLYFIGEVVDVTGHLGGFNFQWAWSSGHATGQFV